MGRARLMTTPIHHTTGYSTLSSLFLPPLDLQKGERDTQGCNPTGSQVVAVFALAFLPSSLTRSRLEQTGLLRLATQWYSSRGTASSGRSVPPVCGDSAHGAEHGTSAAPLPPLPGIAPPIHCPFPCGGYGKDRVFLMPNSWHISSTTDASNDDLVARQVVGGAKVRDVLLDQHLGHGIGFHVGEGKCGCPFVEVVHQDQDAPVPRWGLFQRPKNVHANTLQRVSRSHGLHWRTVVLGRALPPRALRARAAPCVYVTTHPGPVESAPDSCQPPGNLSLWFLKCRHPAQATTVCAQ
ncbi:hypothetical protein T05_5605 [Trichinella murrelli]|uniref:Uncharacterized protein n=1 Tax=Trichinella murrelli TaxID=144512 RepID=A0A0V0TVG6_9BILA|nr:hypothetical protein T05_5605 [Trichinella murrelli]